MPLRIRRMTPLDREEEVARKTLVWVEEV